MSELHFIRPLWLWALLPYLVLLGLLLRNKLGAGNWAQVCDPELLPYVLQTRPSPQQRWPQFGLALAGLLSILALAGPAWQRLPLPVFRNASALVIALDLSRSMDAEDIKPSRLIRARYKIADILKRRKDGQTALLVYSDDAFTVTPLTDDTETINSQLPALTTDIMPGGGSNSAAALQRAAALLQQAGMPQGQILLVTDGVNPDAAADAARQLKGYPVSILAVGTEAGAPIKSPESGFVKDAQGNIVIPKLNAGELQQLADAGGGILQLLRDDDADIENLQAQFERQTTRQQNQSDSGDKLLDQWQDIGPWLLLPVLPLAALAFRRGVLCLSFLLLLPLPKNSYAWSWQDLWQTPEQRSQQAFERQDYRQAAEGFSNPRWKAAAQYKAGQYEQAVETLKQPQSADDYYNRGNALAKAGRLQEAIDAYQQAQKLDPNIKDARENEETVRKALEQQKQQQQQQQNQGGAKQDDQPAQENNPQQPQNGEQQGQNPQQQSGQQQGENQPQQSGEQQPQQKQSGQTGENPEKTGEPAETQQAQDQQQKQQEQQAGQAAQAKPEDPGKNTEQQAATVAEGQARDEQTQADEQWLKRIPDDPSGLLRRKFAYQYQQRARRAQGDQQW